ncbi:MAG: ABC transporter ATP-binding protein [Planctomycetota bacterium JB042]
MFRDFARIKEYLPRYRLSIALGMLAIPVSRGLDLLIPWVIGRGIDELERGELTWPLRTYFLLIVGLALAKGVFKFAMRWFLVTASRRFEEDFRNDLYRHILTLPGSWYQSMRSGDLMSRLAWDVEAVRMFVGPGVMYLTETLFMVPAVLVLAAYDVGLALLLLVPLGLIAWAMKHYAAPIHAESMKGQERLADLSSVAQENFAGVRVVRSFATEPHQVARFDEASEAYRDQQFRIGRLRGRNWTLLLSAKDLGMLILVAAGGWRLMTGEVTIGQFTLFMLYLGLLFWPMVALGWMVGMFQRGRASMQRLNAILDHPPAIPRRADAYRPDAVRGDVELRGFEFGYGEKEVLHGVDLKVPAGTIFGLTGPTGSGKSTLAQAPSRLIDVRPGQVFVDGVDVTEWDPTVLRRAIGFVPQEAFLFADSLRANLALGRDDEDERALLDAVRSAHVERELLDLEDGLDAVVGERGVTLSGGQRQRATIARALAADPRILILDDCLSAVDADTEAAILADLASALRGRTALIVSHRVAALRIADRVAVLDDGRVVEEGTPSELLARRGRLWRLEQRQKAEEELGALE